MADIDLDAIRDRIAAAAGWSIANTFAKRDIRAALVDARDLATEVERLRRDLFTVEYSEDARLATAEAKLAATRAVCAERERELLALKGPCSNRNCSLHFAHAGPCDGRVEVDGG